MDNRILIIGALFILFVVLCLDYVIMEQFQSMNNKIPYSYVDPEILSARNTGFNEDIRRGELKNLKSGDKIQAIKVFNRYGAEKKSPIGYNGHGPLSVDISYYQKYETDQGAVQRTVQRTDQAVQRTDQAVQRTDQGNVQRTDNVFPTTSIPI
jgi:hypothetical protein